MLGVHRAVPGVQGRAVLGFTGPGCAEGSGPGCVEGSQGLAVPGISAGLCRGLSAVPCLAVPWVAAWLCRCSLPGEPRRTLRPQPGSSGTRDPRCGRGQRLGQWQASPRAGWA